MIVSFIQVGVQAVQKLLEEEETHKVIRLSLQGIIIMISTGKLLFELVDLVVIVKFGCWLWSKSIKNSGVQALAQDAMNDVIFKYPPPSTFP